jgi:hypothetical protein
MGEMLDGTVFVERGPDRPEDKLPGSSVPGNVLPDDVFEYCVP